MTVPDFSVGTPDISIPKVRGPKVELPDFSLKGPSVGSPDFSLKGPQISAPDISIDTSLPNVDFDLKAPKVSGPKVDLPDLDFDLKGPKVTMPSVDLPDIDINAPEVRLSLIRLRLRTTSVSLFETIKSKPHCLSSASSDALSPCLHKQRN